MKFYKIVLLISLSVFLVTGNSMALPKTLYDITGIRGTDAYSDTGAQVFALTDTDGESDDATAFLLLEIAGFRNLNTFGLYGFTQNNGGVQLEDKLEIFDGSADAFYGNSNSFATVTLAFEENTVTNTTTHETIKINPLHFGFYLTTPEGEGHTYYSHMSLNNDGYDHALAFNTDDHQAAGLIGSKVVIAFEDLYGGGDGDYNDFVAGLSDIKAVPTPEPATLFLIGSGLISFAALRKKKLNKY